MGQQGRFHLSRRRNRSEGREPAQDSGRTEPALAGAVLDELAHQTFRYLGGQPIGGDHGSAGDPADGGYASDARSAVDEHRAATALSLRAATILHGVDTEILAEDLEQRRPVPGYLDGAAVKGERDRQFGRLESAERVAAAAGAAGVRVVDAEPGLLQPVLEVQGGPLQKAGAGGVDDHADGAEGRGQVVVSQVRVEEHLIAEPGAATGAYRHPQGQLRVPLLLEQLGHLGGGAVGEGDSRAYVGMGGAHRSSWGLACGPTPAMSVMLPLNDR
jgi:hypothetical protein